MGYSKDTATTIHDTVAEVLKYGVVEVDDLLKHKVILGFSVDDWIKSSEDQRTAVTALIKKYADKLQAARNSAVTVNVPPLTRDNTETKPGNSPKGSDTNPEPLKVPPGNNSETENITGSAAIGEQTVNEPKNTGAEKSPDSVRPPNQTCEAPVNEQVTNSEVPVEPQDKPCGVPGLTTEDDQDTDKENAQPDGLSVDGIIIDVRSKLAGFIKRIKDRLSEDELASVGIAYVLENDDFESEEHYQAARTVSEKYNISDASIRALKREILRRVTADMNTLNDPGVLEALHKLEVISPPELDLVLHDITNIDEYDGLKATTIKKMIGLHTTSKHVVDEDTDTIVISDEIKAKAIAIATIGDPLKYLVWQAQRNHVGDVPYQKVLICSIGSTASLTSKGIQPGATGESGSGKDHACAAVYVMVPASRKLDGSVSPMNLFYAQQAGELIPGMILYSEDVEYAPIIPVYKRSTGNFQKGTKHRTVSSGGNGKERGSLKLTIPPRISWWLTSVESVANKEADTRQSPISTDSSVDHQKLVSKEIADARAREELPLVEDEGILIGMAIIEDVYDNSPFKVLIPQAKDAKWLRFADFRGQEQFWDLVDALCIIRWRKRTTNANGWLVADDQDLIDAKDILTEHKGANSLDLTPAQLEMVAVMDGRSAMSQTDLCTALNLSQSTVSARLKSIMSKSSIISETIQYGTKFYTVNTKTTAYAAFKSGQELVETPKVKDSGYRSQQIALSSCYRYVIGVPIGIVISNSNRIPSTYRIGKRVCTEKNLLSQEFPKECLSCLNMTDFSEEEEKNISSLHPENTTISTIRHAGDPVTDRYDHDDATIRQAGDYDTILSSSANKSHRSALNIPIRGRVSEVPS